MQVAICGHAGLFIETAENRVLLDPILRVTPLASGGVVHTLGRRLDLTRMPAPTIIVVTHAHLDHFDPESLQLLPRNTPVVAPQDPRLLAQLSQLGFSAVHSIGPWQSFAQGDVVLTATPSAAEIDEFGLIVQSRGATFWHMSDAEAGPDEAFRIADEYGPVHLVSVKYQPASRVQSQVIRSLGACFDKADVVRSLETACLCKPGLAFPYASGIRFHGNHEWFNKHAFPFRADEITRLLSRRLSPNGRGVTVMPGDVISIDAGTVSHAMQASPFVHHDPAAGIEIEWAPIEPDSLAGIATRERAELRRLLTDLLNGPFAEWVFANSREGGALSRFNDFDVIWQLTVHAGATERIQFFIDFSSPSPSIIEGRNPYANFFAHVSGDSLYRTLRGDAGPELLYACGDVRVYEKIVSVKEGRIWAPPVQGWDLFEQLPELLSFFLRYRQRWNM